MISNSSYNETKAVLKEMSDRQGGSLFFNKSINNILEYDSAEYKTASKVPYDLKEFSISIYNTDYNTEAKRDNAKEVVKLVLFVNPKDLVIGQQQIVSNTYTRRGWINAAWGNQQATLSASGISSGFYFFYDGKGGITNKYRRKSPGFFNLMGIMAMFRNNGWYFMDGIKNPSLFKDGTSRVINVMDSVKIEYDGSTYIGSFSTFTLNDLASNPYRLEYSFEFVVSSFGLDLQGVDGHISKENNHLNNNVNVALQGSNVDFKNIIGLDTDELNRYFPMNETPDPTSYDYTTSESEEEKKLEPEGTPVGPIPEGTFRITRGWLDDEKHGGKCDYRTYTGNNYSATFGVVWKVKTSPFKGGSNYIVVKSTFNDVDIYVRYFHVQYGSHNWKEGDSVSIGTIMGRQGTDNGQYPEHCDFEVRKIAAHNPDYWAAERIDCSEVLNSMWKSLHGQSLWKQDFTTLYAKHPGKDVTSQVK